MKVLGYEIKKGSFKDQATSNIIDYHNVMVHVQLEGDSIKGVCTQPIKIKYDHFIELLNDAKIGIDNLIGLDVLFYYDMNKKPIAIVKK